MYQVLWSACFCQLFSRVTFHVSSTLVCLFLSVAQFIETSTAESFHLVSVSKGFTSLPYDAHVKQKYREELLSRPRIVRLLSSQVKIFFNDGSFHLKKQVMDQCVLPTMTYGCQTWSRNKQLTNKLRTAQRAMERKMLDLKLKDKIPCSEIRKRTKIIDIIEYTLKQKWKWAGHIARLKDNRWTRRCTEWQPRRGKRSRGRPSRRWQDDITEKEGTTWIRKAADRQRWKTLMEGYILQWMDKA